MSRSAVTGPKRLATFSTRSTSSAARASDALGRRAVSANPAPFRTRPTYVLMTMAMRIATPRMKSR